MCYFLVEVILFYWGIGTMGIYTPAQYKFTSNILYNTATYTCILRLLIVNIYIMFQAHTF